MNVSSHSSSPRGGPLHGTGGCGGFTYIGLLIAVALAGVALAGAGTFWSVEAQREDEAQLLFAGDQIRAALQSYVDGSPDGVRRLPRSLADLLEDRRFPVTRRHLRRLYPDPATAGGEWVVIRDPNGAILGVRSASARTPLKRANFPEGYSAFVDAKTLADWRFVYDQSAQRPAETRGANR